MNRIHELYRRFRKPQWEFCHDNGKYVCVSAERGVHTKYYEKTRAIEALRHARIVAEFEEWEGDERNPEPGDCRLIAEDENESYFDVYGEPEGYTRLDGRRVSPEEERKRIEDDIERNGCLWVAGQYWNGDEWETADSVGMCIYDDALSPFENCYIPDIMRGTLEAAKEFLADYHPPIEVSGLDRPKTLHELAIAGF